MHKNMLTKVYIVFVNETFFVNSTCVKAVKQDFNLRYRMMHTTPLLLPLTNWSILIEDKSPTAIASEREKDVLKMLAIKRFICQDAK